MRHEILDIALRWDGETPTAQLILDGLELDGQPIAVQSLFDRLNVLRDRLRIAEGLVAKVTLAVASILDAAPRNK